MKLWLARKVAGRLQRAIVDAERDVRRDVQRLIDRKAAELTSHHTRGRATDVGHPHGYPRGYRDSIEVRVAEREEPVRLMYLGDDRPVIVYDDPLPEREPERVRRARIAIEESRRRRELDAAARARATSLHVPARECDWCGRLVCDLPAVHASLYRRWRGPR